MSTFTREEVLSLSVVDFFSDDFLQLINVRGINMIQQLSEMLCYHLDLNYQEASLRDLLNHPQLTEDLIRRKRQSGDYASDGSEEFMQLLSLFALDDIVTCNRGRTVSLAAIDIANGIKSQWIRKSVKTWGPLSTTARKGFGSLIGRSLIVFILLVLIGGFLSYESHLGEPAIDLVISMRQIALQIPIYLGLAAIGSILVKDYVSGRMSRG